MVDERSPDGLLRTGGTQPLVSIGVPAYNAARYLDEVLTGLRRQTVDDLEIVVCDNASADATEEICRDHAAADPRVRYVRNPGNLGLAENFNRTFAMSRGRYFRWNMADDPSEPDLLAQCVAVLEAEPDVVLAVPGWDLVDADGKPARLDERGAVPLPAWPPGRYDRLRAVSEYVTGPHSIGVLAYLSGLVRSEAMWATGRLGSYPRSDRVLLTQLAALGGFRELPGVTQHIRIHDDSAGSGIGARDYARVWPTFYPGRPLPRTLLPWRAKVHFAEARALAAGAGTPGRALRLWTGYVRANPRQLLQ